MSDTTPTFPAKWNRVQIRRKLRGGDGIRIGPFGSALTLDQMVEEGFKVYGQENVISQDFSIGTRYLSPPKYAELKACSISSGDLLVTMMGTTGRCCVVPEEIEEGIMDSHLIRLRFQDHEVDPSFMALLIDKGHFVKEQIGAGGKGTIMSGLNSSIIKDVWVGLPDVITQQRIAKYVDEQTAKIDRLMEMRRRQMELLKEQRAALIQQAVTRGINSDALMKESGIPWLGEIPTHWEVKPIKYAARISRGRFGYRPRTEPTLYDGPYPFVQTGDVASAQKYLTSYTQTLTEKGYGVSVEFPAGTLLMAIAANIGDLAILGINACLPDSIVGFFPYAGTDVEFLYYQLSCQQKRLHALAPENTQMNLNIDRLSPEKIAFPPEEEQKEICRHINEIEKSIEVTLSSYSRQLTLLAEYRTALIHECVTGQREV
ncbi:restriction endonuclease subunit S [Geomonas sp. Red32]|uniref:restriction endonuclease subunit S n=1 Tax=Geomonas sp. Red32 TaxID=2912856 RepID=UPI00202CE730|nr:restriction endonuclease subunit S [Geomonas sp. Red32]MCM0084520.1 restriction endonuclease subunit S [Geomonas sp. Red32]